MTDPCYVSKNLSDESATVSESLQLKLNKIKSDYESIFSWDIYDRAGRNNDVLTNIIDKIRQKCDIYMENETDFNLYRFCFKLIISFEYFNDENYAKSLSEIEALVKSLDSCTFDDFYKQYANSFNHIARSTCAYISLSVNNEPKKIVENIVPIRNLSPDEKAAICAIKAYVFMEYAPAGNDIALEYADQACGLCPTEPEWTNVWLIAKGRVRRYYHNHQRIPDESEINAAKTLLRVENPRADFLMQASSIFLQLAHQNRYTGIPNPKKENYYKQAAETITKAIMLGKNDVAQLQFCFESYIFLPKRYRSQPLIDEVIEKLENLNYYYVNLTLGKYYFRIAKDYERAKVYFSRGMTPGTFYCTIQLLQVECFLQPVDQFPYVQTLNTIYNKFIKPKRRLIVLAQILMYYWYFDEPEEVMHYLNLFLDQDISDELKIVELTSTLPYFDFPEKHRGRFSFLGKLTTYVEKILNRNCWNTEKKKMFVDTLNRFNKLRQVVSTQNECYDNNQKIVQENIKCNDWRCNKQQRHDHKRNEKSSWFKTKHDRPSTS